MTTVLPDLRTRFAQIDDDYAEAVARHRNLVAKLGSDLDGDDAADTGAKVTVVGEDEAELRRLEERREQMGRALQRLTAGTYGVCEACAQEIPAERLALIPSTTRCVPCQQKAEHRR
jgi:DnaK suppressor protein